MVRRYVTGDIELEVSPAAMSSSERPAEEINVDLGDDLDLPVPAPDPATRSPTGWSTWAPTARFPPSCGQC